MKNVVCQTKLEMVDGRTGTCVISKTCHPNNCTETTYFTTLHAIIGMLSLGQKWSKLEICHAFGLIVQMLHLNHLHNEKSYEF